MNFTADKERAIRALVCQAVDSYASAFSDRHIKEADDENGTINMKIHNVFIAALGPDIQYYSALARSLDSSLGNMLEKMAINIAKITFNVSQYVTGPLYKEQTDKIAEILENYKNSGGENHKRPEIADYKGISRLRSSAVHSKRHDSDYYLVNPETDEHFLIKLKIGGDLDNKKARAEKEALLEQYCILSNILGSEEKIKIFFATAYNRYGEGNDWNQGRVLQFFDRKELLISRDFWNFVCDMPIGYDVVIDEYRKNAYKITDALNRIKSVYLH